MIQKLDRRRLFLNLLPLFLIKDMLRQLQMIQWSEMPRVMATCQGTLGPRQCLSLPQVLHDIV